MEYPLSQFLLDVNYRGSRLYYIKSNSAKRKQRKPLCQYAHINPVRIKGVSLLPDFQRLLVRPRESWFCSEHAKITPYRKKQFYLDYSNFNRKDLSPLLCTRNYFSSNCNELNEYLFRIPIIPSFSMAFHSLYRETEY